MPAPKARERGLTSTVTFLRGNPSVPADTRLWSALQNASGGTWGGCIYDVGRITDLLKAGLAAEATRKLSGERAR